MLNRIKNYLKIENTKQVYDDSFNSWPDAVKASRGYSNDDIAMKVLDGHLKSCKIEGSFERDSVVITDESIDWIFITFLLLSAKSDDCKITILDFGGALATAFFQNQKILKFINDINWIILEQPNFVSMGKKILNQDQFIYLEELNDCLEYKPDMIYFGSSLQYLEFPWEILKTCNESQAKVLYLDRIPCSDMDYDKIMVQKVPKIIYAGSYPAWIFAEKVLESKLEPNWRLVHKFETIGGRVKTISLNNFEWKSLVFVRNAASSIKETLNND